MKIKILHAIEILDSRGIPTLETFIELEDGSKAKSSVPSGSSTGKTEALEMRDGDKARYNGKGVRKAVDVVNNQIANAVIGKDFATQSDLDKFLVDLDGTEYKVKLGGNSILSVSTAFLKATAVSKGLELYEYIAQIHSTQPPYQLPVAMFLIMEGGKHGDWATDIQEFKIAPVYDKYPEFRERLRVATEVFHAMHDVLVARGYCANVGFEGGYAPKEVKGNAEAFELIMEAIKKAGYAPGEDIFIAVDAAASEYYNATNNTYTLKTENRTLTAKEWADQQLEWYKKYPVFSIEDPLDQEAWEDWAEFTKEAGGTFQIIGDDLLTTNSKRIQKAIEMKAVNAVLIKPNQIGTITETLHAIKVTQEAGYQAVVSHRGGETNDTLVADLVVGSGAIQCKFGGPDRGERLAKYNRLLEIEYKLNPVKSSVAVSQSHPQTSVTQPVADMSSSSQTTNTQPVQDTQGTASSAVTSTDSTGSNNVPSLDEIKKRLEEIKSKMNSGTSQDQQNNQTSKPSELEKRLAPKTIPSMSTPTEGDIVSNNSSPTQPTATEKTTEPTAPSLQEIKQRLQELVDKNKSEQNNPQHGDQMPATQPPQSSQNMQLTATTPTISNTQSASATDTNNPASQPNQQANQTDKEEIERKLEELKKQLASLKGNNQTN